MRREANFLNRDARRPAIKLCGIDRVEYGVCPIWVDAVDGVRKLIAVPFKDDADADSFGVNGIKAIRS